MKTITIFILFLSLVTSAKATIPTGKIDTMRVDSYGNIINFMASYEVAVTSSTNDTITLPGNARYVEVVNNGGATDTLDVAYGFSTTYGAHYSDMINKGVVTVSRTFGSGVTKIYVKGRQTLKAIIRAWN